MNILLDVTRLVRRVLKGRMLTGIDRVSMAYVQHYGHTAQALVRWSGRSWILPPSQSKALFIWLETPVSKHKGMLIILKGVLSFKTTNHLENSVLLNTGHIGLGQSDYVRLIRKHAVKPVFFVHDLIPIAYPEYCSPGEDKRHQEKMNYLLTLARGVITNSEATRQELIQYSQQTHQNMPQHRVALLASAVRPGSPGMRPLDKPYFVILGTIEPRKNHALLLQLWRHFVQSIGEKTPHLLVIGQRGWECENVLDLLERCQIIKPVVTEISSCSDADLVTYIHHSQALLFPSFVEGYGLPLIEALALGVPVIASDLPVFREIAGDIIEYIDPLDGKRWGEVILDYSQMDSASRTAQLTRIQQFKVPTWDEHFTQVDSLLTELSHL